MTLKEEKAKIIKSWNLMAGERLKFYFNDSPQTCCVYGSVEGISKLSKNFEFGDNMKTGFNKLLNSSYLILSTEGI